MNINKKFTSFFMIFMLNHSYAQEDKLGTKIVGGVEAEKHEFPWLVNLDTHGSFCGGSIINKDWILTAGHCVSSTNKCTKVTVGDHNLNIVEGGQQTIKSCQVRRHEQYADLGSRGIFHDIALIKLTKSLGFTNTVQSIPVPQANFAASGSVTVAGWGTLSSGSNQVSPVLRKVNLNIVSPATCQQQYGSGSITSNMICAADIGKDSCQGDSGGPLMCRNTPSSPYYNVCGIVSFGMGCAHQNFSGVYTKVSSYATWINTTINSSPPNDKCTCLGSSIIFTPLVMLFLITFAFLV